MKIPTRTLYYVLCYAWERLDYVRQELGEVEDTTGDDLPQNLLASLLCESFARVRRRGLDRGYREHENDPFDRGGATLKSGHLYQLWAYLTNYARTRQEELPPLGVLLYATIGREFEWEYELPGYLLKVRSLDLGKVWPGLRQDLLKFADELAEATGAEARSAA